MYRQIKKHVLLLIILLAFLLRVAALSVFPPGLYSDEVSLGYNASLLLQTGRDEFGRFWPISFESFGDWKPPMQGWLMVPFIAVFGLNEWSVRLPSVIVGSATVLIIYFLVLEIFGKDKKKLALVASLLLAINPWHIFMSRIAMLVSVEIFFISFGLLAAFWGLRKPRWIIVSGMSFCAAVYSYYGSRITVPLLVGCFALVYRKELLKSWKQDISAIVVCMLFLSPLLFAYIKNPLVVMGRAKSTSVFFNDNIRLQLWERHTVDGLRGVPAVPSRILHNKAYYYARDITGRWTSHFNSAFLFFDTSVYQPFDIPRAGYLYLIDAPFFLIGLFVVRAQIRKNKAAIFLLLYLLISPVVASLTFMTPAPNRAFNMVVPWVIVIAIGIEAFFRYVAKRKIPPRIIAVFIICAYLVSLGVYGWCYTFGIWNWTPLQYWHYGKKELSQKLAPLLPEYDQVYMSDNGSPQYIYLAFYLKIPPEQFFKTAVHDQTPDELGWGQVTQLLNISIIKNFNWESVPKDPNALYIGFEQDIPNEGVRVIDRVYYPNGKVAYTIAELEK